MTIKEFAELLGLSTATVSRAFTPGSRIHADTRTRILEQASRVGYAPNPNARQLAQKQSRLIGLDFPGNSDVLADPFLIELARGVQEAARQADYGLVLNTLPRPGGDIDLLREWVFGKAVGGVVIVIPPGFPLGTLSTFAEREVPCVLVMQGPPQDVLPLPTVRLDLVEGARAAVTHLIRLGHRRIGHITSSPGDSVYTAFRTQTEEAGILCEELSVEAYSDIASGRAAMHRLLAAPLPPTAVFARTDMLAMGALRAIRDMGLRVPEDISLIGHDDIRLAELSDPPLTTVRIDTGRIGRMATEALLKCLEGNNLPSKDSLNGENVEKSVVVGSVVETQLIVRSSTGPYLPDVAIAHDRRASERRSMAEQDRP